MHPHTDPRNPLDLPPAALEQSIVQALEAKPEPVIPADFAARLALQAGTIPLPAQPRLRRIPRYGLIAAWSSLIVLTAAIFLLSPVSLTLHSPTRLLALECLLLAQLLALSLWLASRRFPGTT